MVKEEGACVCAAFAAPAEAERNRLLLTLAGMAGLEPTISESKSGVLPLHYIPINQQTETGEAGLGTFSVGWDMGLEPTTPGTTIRCSAN